VLLFAVLGACNFIIWCAGMPGSPFASVIAFYRYPEAYGRVEAQRREFIDRDLVRQFAALKKQLVEDGDLRSRLKPIHSDRRLLHIPHSLIPPDCSLRLHITRSLATSMDTHGWLAGLTARLNPFRLVWPVKACLCRSRRMQ
jgi:hypothetical protein